jgi:hypothetical protein
MLDHAVFFPPGPNALAYIAATLTTTTEKTFYTTAVTESQNRGRRQIRIRKRAGPQTQVEVSTEHPPVKVFAQLVEERPDGRQQNRPSGDADRHEPSGANVTQLCY